MNKFNGGYTIEHEFAFIDGLRDPHVLRGYIAGMKKRTRAFAATGTMTAEEHSRCVRRAQALLRGAEE